MRFIDDDYDDVSPLAGVSVPPGEQEDRRRPDAAPDDVGVGEDFRELDAVTRQQIRVTIFDAAFSFGRELYFLPQPWALEAVWGRIGHASGLASPVAHANVRKVIRARPARRSAPG
jgi:hypothetical protein